MLLNISNILLDLLFVIWNKGLLELLSYGLAEGIAVIGGLMLIGAELKNLSVRSFVPRSCPNNGLTCSRLTETS